MTSLIMPCYFATPKMVKMTQECLFSLKDTDYNDPIILVDDGSPIKGDIYMTGLFEKIVLPTNKGYAGAVNAGLAKAGGDYFIISNNDIEFIQHDWLAHLVKGFEHFDIVSIRTTDADGWLEEDKMTEGDKFGSFWAMKREVYKTIGGLDESFGKGYFEDLDYHKRAEDAGFKVGKNHAGIVHHLGKSTFKHIDPDDESYYKAMEKFKEKYGEVW